MQNAPTLRHELVPVVINKVTLLRPSDGASQLERRVLTFAHQRTGEAPSFERGLATIQASCPWRRDLGRLRPRSRGHNYSAGDEGSQHGGCAHDRFRSWVSTFDK